MNPDAIKDGGQVHPCSVCGEASTIIQGHQHLCDKHYRFGQMRSGAKRHGKLVPTRAELESMPGATQICSDCGISMNWRAKDGQSTVATLQHYRDGSMDIVCRSCNTRHAFMPGDSYRTMEKDHKLCPECVNIKPLDQFSVDNSRSGVAKRKSICRACSNDKNQEWKVKNRERYNDYQRNYRAMRKESGNPVGKNKEKLTLMDERP